MAFTGAEAGELRAPEGQAINDSSSFFPRPAVWFAHTEI
jgi:hypothetical protein